MLVYKSEVGVIKGTGTRSPGSTLFLIYPLLRFIASNKEGRAFSGAEGFLNMVSSAKWANTSIYEL